MPRIPRSHAKTLACGALIFVINAALAQWLFLNPYTVQMGSIEAAYVGLARYISQHWGDLAWFPLWYGGIPYADTYPPLLHWIVALAINFSGASPGLAYHFVTAVVYCLGPVSLFWMAWRLCHSRECALLAAIGYSIISPSCLLVESVRGDTNGILGARRLQTLVAWGEGPHLLSMLLFPLAVGLLHLALEKRKPWYWVSAGLAVAAVPLTNWLGAMALVITITSYLCAGLPGNRKTIPVLLRFGAVAAYAYAVAVPWLSPATIAVIRSNAPRVASNFQSDLNQRKYVAAVAAAFLLLALLMRWAKVPRHLRFALLVSLVTGASALGSFWYKLALFPQPERYHLEMDMFFWVAAAFAVWPLVRWLVRRIPPGIMPSFLPALLRRRPAFVFALILAVPCLYAVKFQRRTARWLERSIDIHSSIEYKTGKWLDAHLPGSRVFAPGTIGFWLPAFSDAPQITGGFDNGISNPFVPALIFYVYAGDNQQYTVDLLRAYGIDALIGGGKDSAEWYHPISHIEKLKGLTELWRDGGDAVYDIPRRSRSLAHVIRPADVMMKPLALYGFSALDPYLAAIDSPEAPPAKFQWRGSSAAIVTADMKPDQVVSVQVTWDKGWNVSVGGKRVPAWSDKLGQMIVEPHCSGPCTIQLNYDGGTEGILARVIHRLALACGALWILIALLWRKRSDLTKTN